MIRTVFISCVFVLVFGKAPVYQLDSDTIIPDEYIVVFHTDTSSKTVVQHMKNFADSFIKSKNSSTEILSEFNMKNFTGYAFRGPISVVEILQDMPEVEFIEANQVASVMQSCIDQMEAQWGLVRTTERELNLDGIYSYGANSVGDNVDVYVFDTGIYLQHKDLGGRAKWGTDTIDSPSPLTDQHGHGTHAAGTIGGAIFGIAKMANLIAVKVLNRRGKGSTKSIIKGAVWVEDQHLKKMSKITRANGSVANMSIGVRRSHSVNRAVESLIGSGVTTVVAAGNEFDDACKLSPASVKTAITVGCTTSSDRFCVYSNVGKCVNILAPGQGIASCGIRGPVSVTTKSGTSFSVAHVTGVVAKYISSLNSLPTPAEVKKWIEKNATKNMIAKVPKGTPNKLVFMECY